MIDHGMFCTAAYKHVTRAIFVTFAWIMAAVGLYAAVVVLEFYWNVWDWQPNLDLFAWGLMVAIFGFVLVMRLLAPSSRDRTSQGVSLLLCVALLVLGFYVLAPEPLTQGLFAREGSSPFWYRFGRVVVLALPTVVWARGLLLRKAHDAKPPASGRVGFSPPGVDANVDIVRKPL
jgi:hypothetical protein